MKSCLQISKSALIILLTLVVSLCLSCKNQGESYDDEVNYLESIAVNIESEFSEISTQVEKLRSVFSKAYESSKSVVLDSSDFRTNKDGVMLYENSANYPWSLYISGYAPIDTGVIREAILAQSTGLALIESVKHKSSISQAYFNSEFCMNLIYPKIDVETQYPPGLDITTFNFYYEANAKHNAERSVVVIDRPYLDPAGRGWMISIVAPVYKGDDLKGVVGVDITLDGILKSYLEENESLLLVDDSGAYIAGSDIALQQVGLPSFDNNYYTDLIN